MSATMGFLIPTFMLTFLVGFVEAGRVKKEAIESNGWMHAKGRVIDCSDQGTPSVQATTGGKQVNTNIVYINGHTFVMKEPHDPSTVLNLRKKKEIIAHWP